jgi:hypothetical protein
MCVRSRQEGTKRRRKKDGLEGFVFLKYVVNSKEWISAQQPHELPLLHSQSQMTLLVPLHTSQLQQLIRHLRPLKRLLPIPRISRSIFQERLHLPDPNVIVRPMRRASPLPKDLRLFLQRLFTRKSRRRKRSINRSSNLGTFLSCRNGLCDCPRESGRRPRRRLFGAGHRGM